MSMNNKEHANAGDIEDMFDFEVISKGIAKDGVTWFVDMHVMYEHEGVLKEYNLYCTSNGITEKDMKIINFRVEFLDPTYYTTMQVPYDANVFEDIYDAVFDEFYIIFDEMKLKQVH